MAEAKRNMTAEAFLASLSSGTIPAPKKTKEPPKRPDANAILESLGLLGQKPDPHGQKHDLNNQKQNPDTRKKPGTDVAALIGRALAKKKQAASKTPASAGNKTGAFLSSPAGPVSPFEAAFAGSAQDAGDEIIMPSFDGQFLSSETMRNQAARREHTGPLRVAAYIRVSSDSAAQEDSYEIQEQYFSRLLAQNKDWTSAGIYSDYGISATSREKRTGFNRLLRHCREGKVDRIICKSISRFTRNTADFLKSMTLLKECGVTVLFEKEALDTAEHYSEFIVTTLAAIAQEESRSISTNIRWGNSKRFPEGKVRNRDIYGYRYVEGEDAYEELENGYRLRKVEIVEEEAKVVRRIFQSYVDGMELHEIAQELNRERIPAPEYLSFTKNTSGNRKLPDGKLKERISEGWTARNISMILEKERYTGDVLVQKTFTQDYLSHRFKVNEGEMPQYLVRDHHPAIISRELYEEARKRREAKKRKAPRPVRGQWPFSGRLVCAECGRHYRVQNSSANQIWKCASTILNNGKTICHAEKVYEEQLVRMFRRAVLERFELAREPVTDNVKEADFISGRYAGEPDMLTKEADTFVRQMLGRLETIQRTDTVERDRSFLKQQILASQVSLSSHEDRMRRLRAQKENLEVRGAVLGETVDEGELEQIANQLAALGKKQTEEKEALRKLEERLSYLEEYWEALEDDYVWREKAVAWMRDLPYGREGFVEFLNGLTSEYVKAFALSITIHSPLRYTIHWFDDTRTEVTMDSNITDYRCTSDYYNGHRMVEKKQRRRKR